MKRDAILSAAVAAIFLVGWMVTYLLTAGVGRG